MRRGFQVLVSGIVLAGLTLAGAGVASAQEPAKEPAKPVLTLDGDAAIVILLIKPDKTAASRPCGEVHGSVCKSDTPR